MDKVKGRDIDLSLGTLVGEAAQMQVRTREQAFPVEPGVTHLVPTDAQHVDPEGPSYYGLPLLKEPVWEWAVPLYYFLGGAGGAAATLSTVARVLGGRDLRLLATKARWLAAIGDNVGAALLLYDLGRPTRFLNMMRVFNPRSPMSVGSWVLAGSGAANTGAVLLAKRRGFLGALGELAGGVGALLGMPLAGYTGVLVANTAVPVWNLGRRSLPLLFMSSGGAAAGSLLSLVATSEREHRVVERFAVAGKLAELAATYALHKEVRAQSPRAARPLVDGMSGRLLTAATAVTVVSLVASLAPGRSRTKRVASGLLGALGSLVMRYAINQAGKVSARDPQASFRSQRRAQSPGMKRRASST